MMPAKTSSRVAGIGEVLAYHIDIEAERRANPKYFRQFYGDDAKPGGIETGAGLAHAPIDQYYSFRYSYLRKARGSIADR